jgi:hypothetical protein
MGSQLRRGNDMRWIRYGAGSDVALDQWHTRTYVQGKGSAHGDEKMTEERKDSWKTFTEEIETTGQQLLGEINRLIAEGNVHKLNVKSADGEVYLSIPLTGGVVAGGLIALSAPWLAIIAGVAGLVTKVKLEVVRKTPPEDAAAQGNDEQVPPGA